MDVSGTIRAILNRKSGEIFSISPDATVFQAIEMMDKKNVGALLVKEGDRLMGIISERDYTRKVILRGRRSRETKVAEIMSTNLTVTHPREPIEKCLRLMTEKRIRIEWRITRCRFEPVDRDRPFQIRIDQCYISRSAD